MFAIGIDIGSSSIKAVLVESETNEVWAAVQAPATEMPIHVPQPGWAEQDPEQWWQYTCEALRRLLQQAQVSPRRVSAIGLAYQMHGLVAVDRDGRVVRPAIIWCDGRAVDIGRRACAALGEAYCLRHLLNSPGNFTAAKLRWLQENEPHHFERTHRALLPGDYIAYRLTGECSTTICGLSEAILWDFAAARPAYALLQHWGIDPDLLPALVPVFGYQGSLTAAAAAETGRNAAHLPRRRPAQQRFRFASTGSGRCSRYGRHVGRGVRSGSPKPGRCTAARQHLCPRQLPACCSLSGHPLVPERLRQPLPMAAPSRRPEIHL
jgi:xylulokinase